MISGATAIAIVVALVCVRLSGYGIWDPWELAIADSARRLGEAGAVEPARSLIVRMIRVAFDTFATREWAGRLPAALCGVALLAVTFAWARRFAGTSVGAFSLLVLGTTPLFILHSRQMFGSAPTFLAGASVMFGASVASLAPSDRVSTLGRWLWLGFALLAGAAGLFMGGALATLVPALVAVALTWLLLHGLGDALPPAQRWAGLLCVSAGALVTYLVARDVWQHAANASIWIGAAPLDETPPTFERVLEHVFHGFAPWSAVLPVALGSVLRIDDLRSPRSALKLCVVLWATFAYAAQTLFLSSYGAIAFPAPVALAVAAALWLDEANRSKRALWPESLVILLLVGLLIRDYALYPASPIGALELSAVKLPESFNPRREWAALLGGFAAAVGLLCIATPERSPLALKAPYRGIASSFRASVPNKLWLIVALLLWLAMLGFGAGALVAPSALHLSTIARRVGVVLGAAAVALPVVVAIVQILYHLSAKLSGARVVPMLGAALIIGGFTSQWFLPKISEQFSPRGVFDAYNKFAKKGEPLAQHHVEGRAAAYYAQGPVKDIAGRGELVDFLSENGRRWAAFPTDELADIDVAFRKRTQRHLFVASEASSRVALAASTPVAGATDHNPLTRYVLAQPPKIQNTVNGLFEDRVELIGYDLKLPEKDHVGAGQTFTITWYWRVLKANFGSYKIFVHIDGQDQRLNGDHEPVDGGYPVRLWDLGDVIVDRQELSVPATYPSGTYTLYVGFFRGESRLKVVQGSKDEANRLRAGTVRIR